MKPGVKTTEFWTTLITAALGLLTILHPGFDAARWQPLASAVAVLAAAIASGVYALGRSNVKTATIAAGGAAPQVTVPAVAPPVAEVAAGAAPPPAPQVPPAADTGAASAVSPEVPPAATTVTLPPAQ